jgi:YD repeat-containing protein
MSDAAGTATYDHNAAGQVVKQTRTMGGVSYTLFRGYDASGHRVGGPV